MELNQQKAKIGYFSDSGIHQLADVSYATLAYIHEFPQNGYHEMRPVIGQIKPMRGEGQKFIESLLRDFLKFNSTYTAEDVLTSIGRKWVQKGKYVFGNSSLLITTNNPTPLYDTGELSDNFGYRTTINYTLRYS